MPIRRTKTQRPADANTDTPEEIVASAAIDVTTPEDARYLRAVVALGKATSAKPWKWYEDIGEVHYALSRGARIAGVTMPTLSTPAPFAASMTATTSP